MRIKGLQLDAITVRKSADFRRVGIRRRVQQGGQVAGQGLNGGTGRHGIIGGLAVDSDVENVVLARRDVRQRLRQCAVEEQINLLDRVIGIAGGELEKKIGRAAQ